jgi:hypothetical protein
MLDKTSLHLVLENKEGCSMKKLISDGSERKGWSEIGKRMEGIVL